jgi:hypothetical protein
MKYILMMHGKKDAWDEYARWSKQALQRNIEFMQRFNKELHDSGVFVDTKGLAWPQEAKIVRAGNNEKPSGVGELGVMDSVGVAGGGLLFEQLACGALDPDQNTRPS